MTQESDDFEKQITKIKSFLEHPDSEIKWNDHIVDPNTPSQMRQIDITVKRNGYTKHIECRDHKKKQDVGWIEQLIGRKIRLKADMVIGVSSSGFSKTAINAAKEEGIFLRDLNEISVEEVLNWGEIFKVSLGVFIIENPSIRLILSGPYQALSASKQNACLDDLVNNEILLSEVLRQLKNGLRQVYKGTKLKKFMIRAMFHPNINFIQGNSVEGVEIEGDFTHQKLCYETISVISYGDPTIDDKDRELMVNKLSLENLDILRSQKNRSMCIDISQAPFPTNSLFDWTVQVDSDKEFEIVPEHCSVIGNDQSQYIFKKGSFAVGYIKENK
jgi:hypothetical protein